VWKEFGGQIDFVYEHETYWPDFIKMTSERRQRMIEKWRSLGGAVGLKEWDFKQEGGDPHATKVEDSVPQDDSVPVVL
jgi:hypothetical protein